MTSTKLYIEAFSQSNLKFYINILLKQIFSTVRKYLLFQLSMQTASNPYFIYHFIVVSFLCDRHILIGLLFCIYVLSTLVVSQIASRRAQHVNDDRITTQT